MIFICSNSQGEKIIFLKSKFVVRNLRAVSNCLGMKVTRYTSGGILILSRTEYTKLLEHFGMRQSKSLSAPMAVNMKLVKPNDRNVWCDEQYQHRRLIGGLMSLSVCTRPDISFACSQLSQFNSCYDQSP